MTKESDDSNDCVKPKLTTIPPQLTCVADYEAMVPQFVPGPVFDYIAGGSGNEASLRANAQAFTRWQLMNRLLVDCSRGDTRVSLLQQDFRHPILLAPVAYQKLVHHQGEVESARAANALEAGMVVSTLSSCSLEDISQVHSGQRWFQLYFQPDRSHTLDLIRRAATAGYSALVVTLDATIQATNRRAQRSGFTFPRGVKAVNLQRYAAPPPVSLTPNQSVIFQGMMAEAPKWEDLQWLLQNTPLPIVVKGVLHPDDAQRLVALGVAGLVVSNHGGRALDGVPAAIECLPAIRERVGPDRLLLVDGGIRSGYDVFKALALGADAVLIGRPQLYGLAVAGAVGVAHVLRILRDELELCMALSGCPTVSDIGLHHVRQA